MILPETERAYLAGILDGEGCISVYHRKKYLTATVQVSNTNEIILNWLRERFGGGIYLNKENRPTRKPHWVWFVAGQKAIAVIREAMPYLLLKKPQAELILSMKRFYTFDRDVLGRIKGRMTKEDFDKNEELVKQIRKLNQRGVANAVN